MTDILDYERTVTRKGLFREMLFCAGLPTIPLAVAIWTGLLAPFLIFIFFQILFFLVLSDVKRNLEWIDWANEKATNVQEEMEEITRISLI